MKEVDIYYAKIRNVSIKQNDEYLKYFPKELIEKNNKYVRWKDRQANLLGKLLLIKWLEKNEYDPTILKQIRKSKYGRPYLPLDIDFNISHSGDYVVCAVSKCSKLGVDIEEIKDIDIRSFKSVFTNNEYQSILASLNSLRRFYEFWTMKESIIKADGRGLSLRLNKIPIMSEDYISIIEGKKWFLTKFNIDNNYCSFLVTDCLEIKINLSHIKF